MRGEHCRAINHPRRTIHQSRQLADAGWFPFESLNEEENDIIFCARLRGFAASFHAYPNAESQATRTLKAARTFLSALTHHPAAECQ